MDLMTYLISIFILGLILITTVGLGGICAEDKKDLIWEIIIGAGALVGIGIATWLYVSDRNKTEAILKNCPPQTTLVKRVNNSDRLYILGEDGTVFEEPENSIPLVSIGDTIVYVKHPEKEYLRIIDFRPCEKHEVIVKNNETQRSIVPIPIPIPIK